MEMFAYAVIILSLSAVMASFVYSALSDKPKKTYKR